MVGDAEAADGADALAKGPDNEIDVADHALRLGDAAAVLADEAHRMGFVDHYHRAGFLRDADHLFQRRAVAAHPIDAFEDDQLAGLGGQALPTFFQRLAGIVAKAEQFSNTPSSPRKSR